MKRLSAVLTSFKLISPFTRLARASPEQNPVFFHSFQSLSGSGVIREEFLQELADGKRVAHFGFLDSPFSEEKIRKGTLLHLNIKKRAVFLYGIDIDGDALEGYRKITGDMQNALYDIQQDGRFPDFLAGNYELILFSEVLEHLRNPFQALLNLYRICCLNEGSQVCITVPNAFSALGFHAAIQGNEIVHPDHYYYFSPYTLKRIAQDAGFSKVDLSLYSSASLIDSPGITKNGIIAVCEP